MGNHAVRDGAARRQLRNEPWRPVDVRFSPRAIIARYSAAGGAKSAVHREWKGLLGWEASLTIRDRAHDGYVEVPVEPTLHKRLTAEARAIDQLWAEERPDLNQGVPLLSAKLHAGRLDDEDL